LRRPTDPSLAAALTLCMSLHPTIKRAAKGKLPDWASASKARYRHMERVAALLEGWARAADLSKTDRKRWVALGFLHDAVKNASSKELRKLVPKRLRDLPASILHGPAAAALMRSDGVEDEALLSAVAYHTLGHPDFGSEGRILYCADFLDPGRRMRPQWRSGLRERLPDELEDVTREILHARIVHLLKRGRPVQPETTAFWATLSRGDGWARASGV